MISKYRNRFNSEFSEEKYKDFLKALEGPFGNIPFRVAETPVFIPQELMAQLTEAGDEIIRFIQKKDFKAITEASIPSQWSVPGENNHPHFLTFDFGICKDESGTLVPRLIEMQGFPSLYGFQSFLGKTYKQAYGLDEGLSPYLNGFDEERYIALLKEVILGDCEPHEVALMDIDAPEQKTAVDFFVTQQYLGIKVLSLTDIFREGRSLFHLDNGKKTKLKRVYNRLIFDEMTEKTELFEQGFDPRQDLDVEWVTHPNWFYRISKYTMPFLKSKYIPETYFLKDLDMIPDNLENYVLKPLFSFAGMGVIIDVSLSDIEAINDPENWILQKKVVYDPVVQAPDAGVKAEIRLMYLWPDGGVPQLCINLARLSRGKMIGVRYNKDFDWVGGTVGLVESNKLQ